MSTRKRRRNTSISINININMILKKRKRILLFSLTVQPVHDQSVPHHFQTDTDGFWSSTWNTLGVVRRMYITIASIFFYGTKNMWIVLAIQKLCHLWSLFLHVWLLKSDSKNMVYDSDSFCISLFSTPPTLFSIFNKENSPLCKGPMSTGNPLHITLTMCFARINYGLILWRMLEAEF